MVTICPVRKAKFWNLYLVMFCLVVFIAPDCLYAFTIAETTTSIGVAETLQGTDARSVNRNQNQQRSEQKSAQNNQVSAQDIDKRLKEMLENINQQHYPDKKQTLATNRLLQAARKTLDNSDGNAACQYFMLQAWNNYFGGSKDRALKASLKAYKTNAADNDARLTHTALALINGQKPVTLDPEKIKKTQKKSPGSSQTEHGSGDSIGSTGSGGNMSGSARSGQILQLNEDALNHTMLESTVEPLELNCLNSTTFSYDPQQDVLCAMFWQTGLKDGSVADPNDKKKKKTPNTPPQYGPGGPMGVGRSTNNRPGNKQNDPLSAQMDAFGKLFANNIDNPAVKFVAVNLDSSKNARSGVMQKLMENPWPWAQVIAGDSANSENLDLPKTFANLDTTKNSIVIADSQGSVKYAGPADGFLAPLILNDLAPGSASPADTTAEAKPSTPTQKISSTAKTTLAAKQPETKPKKNITEDDEFFDPQAEKLLEHGRGFVKIGRLTSYKKGIDLCRQVINDYPNTKYEQQAREILRKVPERHHKRYKITNQELGLE